MGTFVLPLYKETLIPFYTTLIITLIDKEKNGKKNILTNGSNSSRCSCVTKLWQPC
jgi:hypothetical protein